MRGEAVLHAVEGVKGMGECFVVACVGDDDVCLASLGETGCFEQEGMEMVEVGATLGGEGKDGEE